MAADSSLTRCPTCGGPVEESRLAAIQGNLKQQEDNLRAALHAEHASTLQAALRQVEAQAKAREGGVVQRLQEEFGERLVREKDQAAREARLEGQSQIATLQEQLRTISAQLSTVQEREKLLTSQHAGALEQARADAARLARLEPEKQLAAAQEQLRTASAQLSSAQERERVLTTEHGKALEQARAEAAREERRAGEQTLALLQQQVGGLTEQLSKSEAREKSVATEHAKAIEELRSEAAGRLTESIANAEARGAEKAAVELLRLRTEKADLDEALKRAKSDSESRVAEIKNAQAEELLNARRQLDAELLKQADGFRQKESDLQRQIQLWMRKAESKTSDELGRFAQGDLLKALRDAFPEDQIVPIPAGAPGADVRHQVMYKGEVCGTVLFDSKNRQNWKDEYAEKLQRDRDAANAEHGILVTASFPAGEPKILRVLENQIVLCVPNIVVPLVRTLRMHIIAAFRMRLSSQQKETKTAKLYEFITSEVFANRMLAAKNATEALSELDMRERRAHENVWKERQMQIVAVSRLLRELDKDVATILEAPDLAAEIA